MPPKRAPRPPSGLPNDKQLLDDVNWQILACLAADPRQSTVALARTIGMSAPAVRERVNRGARRRHPQLSPGYRSCRHRLAGHGVGADPAGTRTAPEDRRAGATHSAGQRVSPHLRRGLLPDEDSRARGRGPGRRSRCLSLLRADHEFLHRGNSGASSATGCHPLLAGDTVTIAVQAGAIAGSAHGQRGSAGSARRVAVVVVRARRWWVRWLGRRFRRWRACATGALSASRVAIACSRWWSCVEPCATLRRWGACPRAGGR